MSQSKYYMKDTIEELDLEPEPVNIVEYQPVAINEAALFVEFQQKMVKT